MTMSVGVVLVLVCLWGAAFTAIHTPQRAHGRNLEGEFLEDALGNWLAQFDTYTFMVNPGVNSSSDLESDENVVPEADTEETTATEDEQSSFAPISVSLDEKGLLNPDIDYQVLVESLVAEEGSVFLTLSKYASKSSCGVGGFSKGSTMNLTKGQWDIEHQVNNLNTSIIEFSDSESTSSSPSLSSWEKISDDFWWVQGRLVGGGVLALTFTPPECGCLTMSTYYALPVGTLTLVVGPQIYPKELQALVCVDPSAKYQENDEEEEDEEHDVGESEDSTEENNQVDEQDILSSWVRDNGNEDDDSVPGSVKMGRRQKNRKARKEARRLERKRRMQENRQRIRQAGRRKVHQQLNQEKQRNNRRLNRRRNRQNGRLSKNSWKKLRKHRQKKNWKHQNETSAQAGNSTALHMDGGNGDLNSTVPQLEQDRLIDILLGATPDSSEVEDSPSSVEDPSAEESSVPADVEGENQTSRRKNRRQKKMRRRDKKKIHHPGIKFCCKQGVKHKKYQIILNTSVEEGDVPRTSCNTTSEIVTTFANHQFAIGEESCKSTFVSCCSKFTADMWNAIKNKKQTRRMQRKERRKERRHQQKQKRKEQRKEIRRQRKEQRRRNRLHNEEPEVEEDETTTLSSNSFPAT
ncbi:glutamic acid-rich protein isoform X1 [Cherax quadricarinatus]|uniref:glutamic acid-rich protein isoform X1 n=1 Tax=Cherax quadricarinatus TaxID=27406 RepID=UPI0023789758|nr:glutamic acid-rich protein-like isoform X1 [Cherax quadricarinatus]